MKFNKTMMSWGARLAAALVNRLGTAFGGTLLGWGATGEQVDVVIGAVALIVGVGFDVLVKKLSGGETNGNP